MKKNKTVYVVHCVDTEGPLFESLQETFARIKQLFGTGVKASRQNLSKLQRGEIDLGENTRAIEKLVDPKLMNYKKNWEEIGQMLQSITHPDFRMKYPDSSGNGWVHNWFCVDHVGYKYNPRKRALGDHKVFDYYTELLGKGENKADRIYFHYHPLPYNRKAHSSATFYLNRNHIFEILAKKIIDRQWFSGVFRPGFHAIRPDSHWFLEQWIPFDYSNQAIAPQRDDQDLTNGRFADWRRAPLIWGAYHPSHDDYQTAGGCRRQIFRCLNMEARFRRLTLADVDNAFAQADRTGKAVLSFTNHDYRDMASEIENVRAMIAKTARKWSSVRYIYSNALDAAREYLNTPVPEKIDLNLSIPASRDKSSVTVTVTAAAELFGPQPFLAIKDIEGEYYYDNLDFTLGKKEWRYTFDWQTVPPDRLAKIGIAATGKQGQVEVVVFDFQKKSVIKRSLDY